MRSMIYDFNVIMRNDEWKITVMIQSEIWNNIYIFI